MMFHGTYRVWGMGDILTRSVTQVDGGHFD